MRVINKFCCTLLLCTPLALFAQSETIDLKTIQKIRQEEMERSQVMDIAFQLTDVSGPRLTISPGFTRAANYAISKLKSWGLTDAKLDEWGDFGKGWEIEKSYVAMSAPYYKALTGIPKAWSAGSNGSKTVEVMLISATDSAALEAYRGKLGGKIIIMDRSDVYKHSFTADANRYTDEQLEKMANDKPVERIRDTSGMRRRREMFAMLRVPALLKTMGKTDGAVAILSGNTRGHDGTIFVQGGGGFKTTDPENLLDIMLANEDYMSIVRLLKSGIPVKLEVDVKTKFISDDTKGYNVIAEIKGTDKKLRDEVDVGRSPG